MRVVLDFSDVKEYERILKSMQKSAYPLAVRGTLNDAARIMKTKTIRPEFKENFIIRKPTFITAFTGYDKCSNTFDIQRMQSEAGVYRGKNNQQVGEDLQKQEFGGGVVDRLVPTNAVRMMGSSKKQIMPRRVFRRFQKRYNSMSSGAFVMGTNEEGVILKSKKGSIIRLTKSFGGEKKFETLYTAPKTAKIHAEPFIYPATMAVKRMFPQIFIRNADKQFKKLKIR